MLETPEAVFDALRENHERPHGAHRTVTAEELVEAAEQFDAPDALVTALTELMSAYNNTAESRKAPVVFARLLRLYDTAPRSFDSGEVHALYWYFKWVTSALLDLPEVPLATVEGWLDQMRQRYEAAGHDLQPVAAMRFHLARHTGVGAAEAYERWVSLPRSELSDCEACETRQRAVHHLTAGADERGLELMRPVLDGRVTCAEEPYLSQAYSLLPLLRLGRLDEARSHHLTGYRFARGRSGMLSAIGRHLEFCAHSRNDARGLEILSENRALFDLKGAPGQRLPFLIGAEVLLGRLAADGHGATAAAGPLGRGWTVEELLAHVAAETTALAAAFDARNGTTEAGDRRRARLAAVPLLDTPLPLGLRAAVPLAVPRPRPAPEGSAPEDFAELVARARRLTAGAHPGDTPLWQRIGERVDADGYAHDDAIGPLDVLRAQIAESRGFAALVAGRPAETAAELRRAAELYAAAGSSWPALRATARAESVPDPGASAERRRAARAALDALCARAARMPRSGTEDTEAYLTVLLCRLLTAFSDHGATDGGEPGPAALAELQELTDALAAEAGRLGAPSREAAALEYAADLARRAGRMAGAEEHLRRAIALYEGAEQPWRGIRSKVWLAQLLMSRGAFPEVVDLLPAALAEAAGCGDDDFPAHAARTMLGHALARTGDQAGAVRELTEAVAAADRTGEPELAAHARLQLAGALRDGGRGGEAVAVLESVVADEAATAGVDERLVAQIRLDLARGLRDLDEDREAAREFLALATVVARWEDQATHALVAAEAAGTLAGLGRWDEARAAYRTALEAHRTGRNTGPVAEMARRFAALTIDHEGADGLEVALGYLAEADALADAAGDDEGLAVWFERARTHYRRGRTLASAERFPDAVREFDLACARYAEGGPAAEGYRSEADRVAALIEGNVLDDLPAALARLDAALSRCEAVGHDEAVRILRELRADFAAKAGDTA